MNNAHIGAFFLRTKCDRQKWNIKTRSLERNAQQQHTKHRLRRIYEKMYMRITNWRALFSQYVKYNAWHGNIALAIALPYSERVDSFGFGFVGYFLFIFFFVFTLLCVTSSYVCSYIRMAMLCSVHSMYTNEGPMCMLLCYALCALYLFRSSQQHC